MKRVTGTHVYTYLKCARAVGLDFHGDPSARRPPTEVEEFALQRGRDLEARLTADLGYETPVYPERDFAAGAAATLELLRLGVPGVLQGVLLEDGKLGIADVLRREAGASAFGAHHYVVGDIKSSRAARGDQILQVMFYARLLGRLQERAPEYAYLVLRDGHEERFACADYAPVLDEVQAKIAALQDPANLPLPFLNFACGSCRWSPVCLPELERNDDLSLVQGMTRGLRQMLHGAGITTTRALREMAVDATARRTRLEVALLRRLRRAAEARALGRPLAERLPPIAPEERAVVHLLADPFAGRVHWFGVMYPARAGGALHDAVPASREDELPAFLSLIRRIPGEASIWHYGEALPHWYEDVAWSRRAEIDLEPRLVDLAHRLRGAAVYPGPVFGLGSHVRYALGADPDRAGVAAGVAMWIGQPDAAARLRAKGRSDLGDLAALITTVVEGAADGSDP